MTYWIVRWDSYPSRWWEPRDSGMLLLDIEKAATRAMSYIESMDKAAWDASRLAQAAVEREFIIAGGAIYQLDRRWPGLVEPYTQYGGNRRHCPSTPLP